ncbi:MAG: ATPase, T2SS/T4P/T4SS family, partial [Patescibacteria group bacterium]
MILKLSDELLQVILVEKDFVSSEDMKKAVDFAQKNNVAILDYLFTQNILTTDLLGQALAEYYKIPYFDLNTHELNATQVLKLPEELALKYNLLFLVENKDQILLATDDPTQEGMLEALKPIFPNKKILFAFSLPDDIRNKFVFYRQTLETRFAAILQEKKRVAPEIVDEIVKDAIFYRASDIHFEPTATEVLIRFRIDGVLQDAGRITKEYYDNILNLIKVLARIRTDEHLSAQDGAIRYEAEGGANIDLRVSIILTINGEKVVIRLLSQYTGNLSFVDLGLSASDQKLLDFNMHRQFGMILVTGPTG